MPSAWLSASALAVVLDARAQAGELRIARRRARGGRLVDDAHLDAPRLRVAEGVGQALLDEAVEREACARPEFRQPRLGDEVDLDFRREPPPLLDQRLQRRDQAQLVERGGTQVGEDAAVLLLQRLHRFGNRARQRRRARVAAVEPRVERHRIGAQREQMRAGLVVQFARDGAPLLVMGVDHPLHQPAHVGGEIAERLAEPVGARGDGGDLRRPGFAGAGGGVAGGQAAQRLADAAERFQRHPHQPVDGEHDGDGERDAGGELVARLLPDFGDDLGRIGLDDDVVEPARADHHRQRRRHHLSADQRLEPGRRRLVEARRRRHRRRGGVLADGDAHVAQVAEARHQRHRRLLRIGRRLHAIERGDQEFLGEPRHRALFGRDARARLRENPRGVADQPQ